MSDNVLPPTNPEANPETPPIVCASGCQHGTSGGLLRAVLYTPVVVMLGGLAALATFPELAQYASPLIDHLPKSAMNAKCPFQCQSSSNQSIDLSNPVYHQEKSCCESGIGANLRLAALKQNAASAFSCCEANGACPASSEGKSDGAVAMVITEEVSAETPADATAVANVAEADSASN